MTKEIRFQFVRDVDGVPRWLRRCRNTDELVRYVVAVLSKRHRVRTDGIAGSGAQWVAVCTGRADRLEEFARGVGRQVVSQAAPYPRLWVRQASVRRDGVPGSREMRS